jgi:hypothetical protein
LGYTAVPQLVSQPDIYLLTRGCNDIGIKLRKGKNLEIKLRRDIYDIRKTDHNISGVAENWIKLKWKNAELRPREIIPLFFTEHPAGHWVHVRKMRQKLYCDIPVNQPPKPASEEVKRGVSWEITYFEDKPWWSIAFDAIGDEKEEMDILQQGIDWALRDYPFERKFPLRKEDSYGFPEWQSKVF